MKNLKKIYDFVVIFVFVLAAIGGTAYLFYFKQYLFGVTSIALIAMAVPYLISRIKDIQGQSNESAD